MEYNSGLVINSFSSQIYNIELSKELNLQTNKCKVMKWEFKSTQNSGKKKKKDLITLGIKLALSKDLT